MRSESIIGCAIALGVGACGPGDRGGDDGLFGENSGVSADASATGDSGSATNGQTSGQSASADDTGGGPGSGADGSTGAADGPKFDLGDAMDLSGADDGGNGEGCKYLDMLFVVDISGSMQEEKANLNANFPMFVQVLDDYIADPSKGALGYRLGATNSSFQEDGSTTGLDGKLENAGGLGGTDDCGTMGVPWLDGPSAGIADNFTCLATNPKDCTNSCSDLGNERPLDAMVGFADMHAAGQPNEGFYRGEESLLVIVTLTDEDDSSENTPAMTKAALDAFTGGEERYVIVTVSGPENQGCMSAFGDAAPTPILHEFTSMVPNGLQGDICAGDLTQALQDALELITFSCDVLPPPEG
jgi:hypothetical protein